MSARQQIALWGGRLTARLPGKLNQTLWRGLRLVKPQPVYRLTGKTRADTTGTMIVAGLGPAANYLPTIFFAEEPTQEFIRSVPIFRLSGYLRAQRERVDLTVLRVDTILARSFLDRDYLPVPEWVRSGLTLPIDLVQTNARNGSLKQDLRLGRKYGFTAIESHSEADLAEFYTTMFRPHTVGRHQSDVYLKSFDELKALFRRGCLLWIMLDGRRVGGMMVTQKDRRFFLAATGVLSGDESLLRKGVLSAGYFHAMEYANRTQCTSLDFGGTRPSLNDGLLYYKRKWGARLDSKPTNRIHLLTYWPTTTPEIVAMLKHAPLIFLENEKLSAVHGDPAFSFPSNVTAGLNRLYAARPGLTMRDWEAQPIIEETHAPIVLPTRNIKPKPSQ
jgi:hypothetical protein